MKTRLLLLVASLLCLVPVPAFAHPGHGHSDPGSWRHYLIEPVHVLLFAAAVGVSFASWHWLRRGSTTRR